MKNHSMNNSKLNFNIPESTDKVQQHLLTIWACLWGQVIGVSEMWTDTSQERQNQAAHFLVLSLYSHHPPAPGQETTIITP